MDGGRIETLACYYPSNLLICNTNRNTILSELFINYKFRVVCFVVTMFPSGQKKSDFVMHFPIWSGLEVYIYKYLNFQAMQSANKP